MSIYEYITPNITVIVRADQRIVMSQVLSLYLSQHDAWFCPPASLDERPTYRIRLYATAILLVAAILVNYFFISTANAFHRKHVYKNITVAFELMAFL